MRENHGNTLVLQDISALQGSERHSNTVSVSLPCIKIEITLNNIKLRIKAAEKRPAKRTARNPNLKRKEAV